MDIKFENSSRHTEKKLKLKKKHIKSKKFWINYKKNVDLKNGKTTWLINITSRRGKFFVSKQFGISLTEFSLNSTKYNWQGCAYGSKCKVFVPKIFYALVIDQTYKDLQIQTVLVNRFKRAHWCLKVKYKIVKMHFNIKNPNFYGK